MTEATDPGGIGSTASDPPPVLAARAFAAVLHQEGGFVDHLVEPGGCSYRGITRATLAA
jgi:Glycosyl hydrolase 108